MSVCVCVCALLVGSVLAGPPNVNYSSFPDRLMPSECQSAHTCLRAPFWALPFYL